MNCTNPALLDQWIAMSIHESELERESMNKKANMQDPSKVAQKLKG